MTHKTRREFLEDSMFAAVAASVGLMSGAQPFRALGSDSPNERLRVAVLGVNGRGKTHIAEFMRRRDCEVAAIVDPDELVGHRNGVERVKKATGRAPAFYQDMRKAFDDPSIDIVSIATPNHWHSLAAIWAMQAGKDVYVEKPISHNVSEGRRVVEVARKEKRICQAGTQGRSYKAQRDAIAFIQQGKIGPVKLARALCYKPRGSIGPRGNYDVPASVDYNQWLGPAPEKPLTRPRFHYDWHWQWDYGNGDLGNQGIHQMDIARWGLGVDDLGRGVVSFGGRLGYIDAGETANTQVSVHDFGDKKLIFEVRGLRTGALRGAKIGVIFYGPEGYVVSTSNYGTVKAFDRDGQEIATFRGGSVSEHFANFIDAVRSRRYEDLHGEILEGHLSSALCHLGNISYRLGERSDLAEIRKRLSGDDDAQETLERFETHLRDNNVDLKQTPLRLGSALELDGRREVFTGEWASRANPMLTREYRKPFVVPEKV